MRQRNKPWADDFLKENDNLILSHPASYKGKWHEEIFQNKQPIHVEIGTGKGQFIVNMAQKHPEINFVGIELAKSIIVDVGQKVLYARLENVYLIRQNAHDLVDIFAEGEVDAIYLNFSDPWPKNRHEKRRLTYHTFLDKYRSVMHKEGEIMLKTDKPDFFAYSLVSFSKAGMTLDDVHMDLHQAPCPECIMTEYEERFIREGKPIFYCSVHL